jgi:hypothetical protein
MNDEGCIGMIEGQRARARTGLPERWPYSQKGRVGNGGLTQRFARMQYVVTGLNGGTDRRWTGQRARQLNNPGLEHPMHTLIKGGRD